MWWEGVVHATGTHVEVRGKQEGVGFFLPPCGAKGWKLGHQVSSKHLNLMSQLYILFSAFIRVVRMSFGGVFQRTSAIINCYRQATAHF